MANYLWRKLSDKEKESIREDARELILNFGDVIEQLPAREEAFVEREQDVREELAGEEDDNFDKELALDNAPKTDGDCIIAEKGSWIGK